MESLVFIFLNFTSFKISEILSSHIYLIILGYIKCSILWVLSNRDIIHGVSIHYVSSELDCGPLIAQGEIKTKTFDDINSLVDRIHKIEHLMYPEIIKYICEDKISLNSNQVKFINIKTKNCIIYNKYEI